MAIGFFWTSLLLCVFLTILAADKMGMFRTVNHFPVDGRVSTSKEYSNTVMHKVNVADRFARQSLSLEAPKGWDGALRSCLHRKEQTW